MKIILSFLAGLFVGMIGVYFLMTGMIENNITDIINQTVIGVQSSLSDITVPGTGSDNAQATVQQLIETQKQKIITELEAKKQDIIDQIKESTKLYIGQKIDDIFKGG